VKPLFGVKTWVKYGLAALILREHIYIRLLFSEGKVYFSFYNLLCLLLFVSFQYANNNNVHKSIETLAVLFTPVTFLEIDDI